MKKVFIVLVNYNGEKDTKECLDSLKKIKHERFEFGVVVVDNDPDKRIKLNKKDYASINLEVIEASSNLGFSGGNNLGIKHALKNEAEYVLLLNNDTFVQEDFLEKLIEVAEKKNDVGLVVPKIYFAKGSEFHKDRYKEKDLGKVIWYAGGEMDWKNIIGFHAGVDEVDEGQFDKELETNFASGCCILIKRKVFEKIGFLDEKYFLYYEDSDFSIRARRAGFGIIFQPKSIIWHKNAGSTGGSGSKLQDYYITRNRLIFGNSYASFRSRLALNRQGVIFMLNGRVWQREGAKDYYMKKLGRKDF